MPSLEIEKLIFKFIFNKGKISISKALELALIYCDTMISEIIKSTNQTTILNSLFEYLFVFNYLYKSIGLLVIMNPTTEINSIDQMLKKYNTKFFNNRDVYEKLLKLNPKLIDESIVLSKIIKEFEQKYDENKEEMIIEINKLSNLIRKDLDRNQQLTITDKMKPYLPEKVKSKINLTRQNYYFLHRKIKNPELRNSIEETYFQKTEAIMIMFSKLILLRHKYANISGYKTYYNFLKKKSQADSDDIKVLINDLIAKLEDRSRKEIERIHRELKKDGYDKKVNLTDIIYYYEQMKAKNLFKPSDVVKVIIQSFKEYFNIIFEQQENSKWQNISVQTYVIKNGSVIMGYLYLDLEQRKNKNITSPISVHLCQQYHNLDNQTTHTKVVIVSGYDSLNNKCITYPDVISLFKEFGYSIQLMAYTTTKGISFKNEFDTMLSQILEYIAWEKTTIEKLCSNKELIDHILFTRFIDFANSIKLRAINVLFDHVIHNSEDLSKIIENNIHDEKYMKTAIIKLYQKLYSDFMVEQNDVIDRNIKGIHPSLIYQELNNAGLFHIDILNQILSFSIFSFIKKDNNKTTSSKDEVSFNGNEFISHVLNSDPERTKKLIDNYISKFGDSYAMYLENLIGYTEIDTEVNRKIGEGEDDYFSEDSD